MDFTKLCRGCFHTLPEAGMTCPHCGFNQAAYERTRERESLPTDTILRGAYILGRSLGRGGFGITYIGWHINLEKAVAIKEFFPKGFVFRNTAAGFSAGSTSVHLVDSSLQASYRSSLQGFLKEAKTLGRIRLPGVVTVHDCFEENGTAYIVMDYVNGHDLKTYMKDNGGKVSEAETLRLLHPVITSLRQLHQEDVIHRDISPDNILVNQKGESILVDFGAARNLELRNGTEHSLTVILKPGFAPIEQYDSHGSQGPWTDVYALCATMYKMMTGITPAEPVIRLDNPENRQELLANLKRNEISDKTSNVLLKGMEVFPRNRFQNMSELESVLYGSGEMPGKGAKQSGRESEMGGAQSGKAAEKDGAGQSGMSKPDGKDHSDSISPQRSPKRAMTGIIILAAALMLAAVIGGIFYYRSQVRYHHIEEDTAESVSEPAVSSVPEIVREAAASSVSESISISSVSSPATEEESVSAATDESDASVQVLSVEPAVLKKGSEINLLLKKMAGTSQDVFDNDTNIRAVVFTDNAAPAGAETSDLAESGEPVIAWFDEESGTIYIHTEADKMRLNEDSSYMFSDMNALEDLDVSRFDTSSVTNMSYMFYSCNLVDLDLSGFDTSSVTDMSGMFNYCIKLTKLDLSSFDTSSVTNMSMMFQACINLTKLNLSSFDTSSVTNMSAMFQNCSALTALDLSRFDTSSVTNMDVMFDGCSGLTELDVSVFDTSSVTSMQAMFRSCSIFTGLDLSSFDTSSVTNMREMLQGCSSLIELDLSSFDTSSVTDMAYMFRGCSGLTNLDLSGFDTSSVTNMDELFKYCDNLTELITQDARLRSEYENK